MEGFFFSPSQLVPISLVEYIWPDLDFSWEF